MSDYDQAASAMLSQVTDIEIALNLRTAEELKRLYRAVSTSMFELAKMASQLRRAHIDPKTGNYCEEFIAWWENNKLEDVFGKKANFSKYATAGDAIFALQRSNIEESAFPTSTRTLYEIGRLSNDKRAAIIGNSKIIRPDLKSPELKAIASSFPPRNEEKLGYKTLAKVQMDSAASLTSAQIDEIVVRLQSLERDFAGLRIMQIGEAHAQR